MASATEIRKGSVLLMDGVLFVCVEFQHSTPGNLRAKVQTKLKNLSTGQIIQKRFSSTERVEIAFLEKRACEYLYQEGSHYVFMDQQNYEQYHLSADVVSDVMPYILPNTTVQVTFHDTLAVSVELPGTVELKVAHTEPGIKGDTVSNVFKPATLETGLEVKVPNHIGIGDVVRVSTQTGEFLGRATTA
ncbi:MAG: elongation factor P [Planctomycetaceae bacterium]